MIYRVEHIVNNRDLYNLIHNHNSSEELELKIKREMIMKMLRDEEFLNTFALEQFRDEFKTTFRILINI